MKMDTNTNGHRQWFYFSVRNLITTTVKFNIYRFKKKFSLFQRGMKPYVLSVKSKKGWKPSCNKIFYRMQKNDYKNQNQTPTYYLTFQYKFEFPEDEVYFSSGLPYTVSYLNKRLIQLNEMKDQQIQFEVSNIGKTLCGQNLNLLTINSKKNLQNVNYIIVNARTHPGQTSSSWVLDGFLQKILKDNNIKDWIVQNNICLKILPMLNPDGVFMGNYRTGVIGQDFNRKFASGRKQFFPQIHALKKLIGDCRKAGKVFLFLDLHGHSILKNSFIYGPSQNLFTNHPLRNLPFNLWHHSKYFRLSSCKFKFSKDMMETARIHFQVKESILTYTCETSLGLYYQGTSTIQMMQQDYKSLGGSIINSITQLLTKQKIANYIQNQHQNQTLVTLEKLVQNNLSNNYSKPLAKDFLKTKQIQSKTAGNTKREKQRQTCIQKIKNIKKQLNQEISKDTVYHKNIDKSQKLINKSIKNALQQSTAKAASISNHQHSQLRRTFKFNLGATKKSSFYHFGLESPSARQQEESPVRASRVEQNKNNRQAQFKIRRKSDILKVLPESIRKKLGPKLQFGFTNSNTKNKISNTIQTQYKFERSATYDSSYLSTQIEAVREKEDIQQDELEVINQKFSQQYESMNDSDNSSQDLEQKQKQYIIECIKINKKIKTNMEQDEQMGQMEYYQTQDLPSNIPMTTNINGFKQYRFRSIETANKVSIPFRSTKRQVHKFRDYTYKSLGKGLYEEQQSIMPQMQMVQKKQLNQRINRKNTRQPYLLIQIRNKNHDKPSIGRAK